MRILMAHVAYQQRGGEDDAVMQEHDLLREAGCDVHLLTVPSSAWFEMPIQSRLKSAAHFGSHRHGKALIGGAVEEVRPDVVHFHNLYPLFGPGAMVEVAQRGVATVHTLHNWRLSCIAGTQFRRGSVCERCAPGRHSWGVAYACYRGSHIQSTLLAQAVSEEWNLLLHGVPDLALCISEHNRSRLVGMGAPADALAVKPNFVSGGEVSQHPRRSGAVYVGRLSAEKGIVPLLMAWREDHPDILVVGDGPERARVAELSRMKRNVRYVGWKPRHEVREALARARCSISPTRWCHAISLTSMEAMSLGTPVVGFDHGEMSSLHRINPSLVVPQGAMHLLADAAALTCALPDDEWVSLSSECLSEYRTFFAPESNRRILLRAYDSAILRAKRRSGS